MYTIFIPLVSIAPDYIITFILGPGYSCRKVWVEVLVTVLWEISWALKRISLFIGFTTPMNPRHRNDGPPIRAARQQELVIRAKKKRPGQ